MTFALSIHQGLFVLITTVVVVAAMLHAVVTLRPGAWFYACSALFFATMVAVLMVDNLGYLWIAMEAMTVVSAPLVAYGRGRPALEAAWKYLVICSVGIAFAFFGTALLYTASDGLLSLTALQQHASSLPRGLTRLAFVFMLLGYGTKAGLFPLHNWLPDAHSEAPAPASAMLSGAMLNCALVPLWRLSDLMTAAGDAAFVHLTLLPMGVLTVVTASLFLLRQHDVKRLLAYSSMENVGCMAVAIALGSPVGFALLAINHSLLKVALFLLSGNLYQEFGTKKLRELRGLLRTRPREAGLLMLAAVAVAGTPPFGSFLAEWQILGQVADAGHLAMLIALCVALAIAFIAICTQICGVLFGEARPAPDVRPPLAVPACLLVASLALGVMVPPALLEALCR